MSDTGSGNTTPLHWANEIAGCPTPESQLESMRRLLAEKSAEIASLREQLDQLKRDYDSDAMRDLTLALDLSAAKTREIASLGKQVMELTGFKEAHELTLKRARKAEAEITNLREQLAAQRQIQTAEKAILIAEVEQNHSLRAAAAWAYQLAGAVGCPANMLDNLSALANGRAAPHGWVYPAG